MKFTVSKKAIIWTAVIVLVAFLLYNLPFVLLQDRILTREVGRKLRKGLAEYGLNVEIGKIHWVGGGKFEAALIAIEEIQDGDFLVGTDKLVLKTNLLALAGNLRKPEAVLQEIVVSGPRLRLEHYSNGTWNYSPLFAKKKKGKSGLRLHIVIRNGTVDLEDYRYGKFRFEQVDGRVDLQKYPMITWDLKGKSTFGENLAWKSGGKLRSDQSAGMGSVNFSGLPLRKAYQLLPRQYPVTVIAGNARGSVDFAWEKSQFWLEKGHANLENSRVGIPQLQEPLLVKSGEISFSPREIHINRSRILYKATDMLASGTLLPGTSSVNIAFNSKRARLEDILELFPEIPKTQIKGNAKLRLEIAGRIDNPLFNGDISIHGARVVSNGETINDISGRATIKRNNIFLERFDGNWEGSAIRASGMMKDIYSPVLDLDVVAKGLRMEQFKLDRMDGATIKMVQPADFHGKLSGVWNDPRLSGEAEIGSIEFNDIAAQDLKVGLSWEPMAQRLKITSLNGSVWEGRLSADGIMTIDPQGAKWEVSGKIDGANLSAITIIPDVGIKEGTIDADGLWKGSWKNGKPFEPGTLMGVIHGYKITYMNTLTDEISAVYSLDHGNMRVDSIEAKIGEGRIFGNLVTDQSYLSSNVSAENIQLEDIFPERFQLPIHGSFQGSLHLAGNINDLNAGLNGEFKNLEWDDKIIGTVTGNIRYRFNEKEVTIDHLVVNNPSGDYSIAGMVGFERESPVMNLQMVTDNLKLKGVMNWLPLDPEMKIDGTGRANLEIKGTFATPSIVGKIYLVQPQFANLLLDEGIVEIKGDLNRLELVQCQLNSEDARFSLKGLVERDKLSLSIGGTCDNLETFKLYYGGAILRGKANLNGSLEGDPQHPVLSAAIKGEEISFGNIKYPQLTAKIKWLAPRLEVYDTVFTGGDSSIHVNGSIYTDNPARFDLVFDVEQFRIEEILKIANVSNIAVDGRFNGKISFYGSAVDPRCRLTGDIMDGKINTVPVNGEVNLSYAGNKATIEKVLLRHGTGTFYLHGTWEKDQELRLKGSLNQFPLQTVNSFISFSELKLSGLANADFDLVWGNQMLRGDFSLNGQDLQVNKDSLGTCSLIGSVNETGLSVKSGNLNVKNGNLTVTGRIPWPDKLRAALKMPAPHSSSGNVAELNLTLKNVPTDLINAYVAGFTVNNGEVNGQVNLTWIADKPQLTGRIDCKNAQLNLPDLPLAVNMVQVSMVLDKNRATINQASGVIEKGRVDLSGEIDFSNLKQIYLNLDCAGSKVYFKNFFYDGMGDFNLKLAGPWDDAILMGNILVYNCKVGGLTLGKVRSGKGEWNPRIDLMVKMGNKVRFRQIGVADLSVDGALHIKGSVLQPQFGGEVTTRQGVVTFYSQTFKINRGEAVFSYSQSFNPFVDVEASLVTPKAEIIVTLKGQVGTDLVPVLSSRPAMSQKDIFALLNWSDLNGEEPLTIDNVVGGNLSAVTDTLFGDFFFRIGNVLNVDYFYLETDYRSNEYRLSVGDYITDNLFVSYTRLVLPSVEDTDLEKWSYDYHLTSKLALGGSYTLSEGRSWRLSYSFKF
jgi:autotransporter translocation and assembly factor TamB